SSLWPTSIEWVAVELALELELRDVQSAPAALPSCTGLETSVIVSEKRPVCRSGELVVFTRIRYGPVLRNARDTRDAQPGPPSSFTIDCASPSPRMMSTGSKSLDDRSIVISRPGVVVNWYILK